MTLYVIAGLVVVLIGGGIFLLTFGKKSGSATTSAKVAEKTAKVQQAQAQAAAEAKAEDVVDRLRRGGF